MLSKIRGFSVNKLNPSGAPLLPNLRRYQALAVLYTASLDSLYLRQKRRLQVLGIYKNKSKIDGTQADN